MFVQDGTITEISPWMERPIYYWLCLWTVVRKGVNLVLLSCDASVAVPLLQQAMFGLSGWKDQQIEVASPVKWSGSSTCRSCMVYTLQEREGPCTFTLGFF
jgi:hypothetical protein